MKKIVLMYHDIYHDTPSESGFDNLLAHDYKIEARLFEEHVKYCVGRDILFTFDDGGISFLTVAAPILEKYGFRGVFFISTSYIGTPGFMTIEQIKELVQRGHIVGSHTHTHPENLAKLTINDIYYEWQKSVEILKSITGVNIICAGIPYGNGVECVYDEALRCGITQIYTSVPTNTVKYEGYKTIYGRYVIRNGFDITKLSKIVNNKYYRLCLNIRYRLICFVKFILGSYYKTLRERL